MILSCNVTSDARMFWCYLRMRADGRSYSFISCCQWTNQIKGHESHSKSIARAIGEPVASVESDSEPTLSDGSNSEPVVSDLSNARCNLCIMVV